jgi:hypothetical protein
MGCRTAKGGCFTSSAGFAGASLGGLGGVFRDPSDEVMQALGLYREQAYREHDGHQPVTGVFAG